MDNKIVCSQTDMIVNFNAIDPDSNQIIQNRAKFERTDEIDTIDKR